MMINKNTKMKNSGIAWLGQIPEGWEMRPLWTIGDFLFSGIDKKINEDEFMVKMVNYTDVYGNKLATITRDIELMEVSCPKNKLEICMLKKGDMIFTPSSETIEDIGISAVIVDEIENTVFSYHTIRFRSKKIDLGYKKYVCNNHFVLNQFSRECKGTTRKILGREEFRWALVLLPPLPTQKAIADYLDKKTSQITKFIDDKKRMIELLKEQKQAIIYNAVTKGIDKNVEMKNSGIAWLGEIPEGWEVRRLKFLGQAIIGLTYNPKDITVEGKGTLVLRSSNLKNGRVEKNDNVYVSSKIPSKLLTRIGDILICSRNGSVELVGKNALIDKDSENLSFGAFTTVFRSEFFEYLHAFFNSSLFSAQSGLFSTSTINQLTTSILNNMEIPFPINDEVRKNIVTYIKKETLQIDTAIKKIEQEIELVEEYKKSLIYHAVTGKIAIEAVNNSIN